MDKVLKLNSRLLENKRDSLWIPCSELTVAHPEPFRVGRHRLGCQSYFWAS